MGKVVKGPWSLRMSARLPAGSKLWDVEDVPVAEVPTEAGGRNIRAFDNGSPEGRPFPWEGMVRNGAGISSEDWDKLVDRWSTSRSTYWLLTSFR